MPACIAIISILSFFAGQWLVTKRSCVGFLVWAGSNLLVAVAKFASGDPSTGSMFMIYFLANGYSLLSWAKVRT
jgi:hypothetical protein